MLDDRKATILAALVEDYIDSGAPVSSRSVLERSGLECSSATVRNELVVLESEGYVVQPHTSAGRVPTERGYRYYVDHLSPGRLRGATQSQIETFFSTVQAELGRILRETSDLLSDITRYPAIVLGPGLRGHHLRDLHVLGVEPGTALLILVTDTGRVHQAVLKGGTACTPSELASAQELLRDHLVGGTIADDPPAPETDGLPAPAVGLVTDAMVALSAAAAGGRDIYVGGTSRMVELWADLAKLHGILSLLDREAAVALLLDDQEDGTTVRIGPETGVAQDDLAVVSTPYAVAGTKSRIGVLGPLRMDYRRTISVVEEVSEALGETLSG
jgi:heat-inducible transcriptional repressor